MQAEYWGLVKTFLFTLELNSALKYVSENIWGQKRGNALAGSLFSAAYSFERLLRACEPRSAVHPTFCTLCVREVWCTKKCRSTICSSNNSPGAKGKRVIWRPFASDCVGSSCHCSNECVLLCRSLDTGVKGVNLLKEVGGRWCGPEFRGRCGRWRTRIERLP